MIHELHPYIADKLVRRGQALEVLLVGAGGNGSKMLFGLKNLHLALQALGYAGLRVCLADGDTVSESNLLRQAFYPADLGLNKATVLIHRLNLACGLDWNAHAHHLEGKDIQGDVVISCVDSRQARAAIYQGCGGSYGYRQPPAYWLDLGNGDTSGQLVLGCPSNRKNPRRAERLRSAAELFPELVDTSLPDDDTPSCSTLEALERQDLFINDLLVTQALNLLWQLLKHHQLSHHGAFVNATTGNVTPLTIDPTAWRRLKAQSARYLAA